MSRDNFPTLHGRHITSAREFKNALVAATADLAAGRISRREANAIKREARAILMMVLAAVSRQSAETRCLSRLLQANADKKMPRHKGRGKGRNERASITATKSILQS